MSEGQQTLPEPVGSIEYQSGTAPQAQKAAEFAAFISYRHVEPDRTHAIWLHKKLETYRIPKKLPRARTAGRRIGRVFRDEEELRASANLATGFDGWRWWGAAIIGRGSEDGLARRVPTAALRRR
ncbi:MULTISPECIES: hypothetical protein [unclassified Bradyrhizobium]|uniref:hypothetical protein n=1 Tax=unclassified Bradyrhizobium TaxID=2631580 RepID=UPI002916F927|nr:MULTISPECIES: hypothetical protein [unclassified Bradyrhizobium]